MSIDDFKSCYASKSPAEKLDLLLVQVDYYGDDKKDYAEARCRLNSKDAQYYYNEAVSMMERIMWLHDEVKVALAKETPIEPVYHTLNDHTRPFCGACKRIALRYADKYCAECGQAVKWSE